ncbi:hypothetical protein VV02_18255 [Luteipulveratus mongoliensis]|uniref:Nudix hydrolase domain-containing protein n=2 Tax=Luteipulveratus mongoliensis TaxID=571913 RepID=A0A0K1JQS1_9MICO|nr:hypothetical protein VV02_18255 [Luteipulveratus mongoliensis]
MGAGAAVMRDGRLLLTRRSDNGLWCLPGGGVEAGERWSETAVREVREETGLEVRVTSLLGACTDPDRVVVYPDGERVQIYDVSFRAEVVAGEAGPTDEVSEVGWFGRADIARIPVLPLHRHLIDAAFAPQDPPIWS